jgi:hypothetical protein
MYDLIYLITAHQSPECLNDLLHNIFYFHSTLRICIMLHLSESLYRQLQTSHEHILIYPNPWNKQPGYDYSIMKKHMELIEWSIELGITTDYFIPLASNCLFHRHVTKEWLQEQYQVNNQVQLHTTFTDDWHWPDFSKNKRLIDFFNKQGIHEWISYQHEGLFLPYEAAIQLYRFITTHSIESLIETMCPFEEILLPTLLYHYTKRFPHSLCTIFWKRRSTIRLWEDTDGRIIASLNEHTATIEEIKTSTTPCAKAIPLEYDHPVRVWIANRPLENV